MKKTIFAVMAMALVALAAGCSKEDPETGFDLAYQTYFGMDATIGEAQIYDAAMLIGYAQYLRMLRGKEMSFRDAMRQLVSGRDEVNATWRSGYRRCFR